MAPYLSCGCCSCYRCTRSLINCSFGAHHLRLLPSDSHYRVRKACPSYPLLSSYSLEFYIIALSPPPQTSLPVLCVPVMRQRQITPNLSNPSISSSHSLRQRFALSSNLRGPRVCASDVYEACKLVSSGDEAAIWFMCHRFCF